MSDLRFTLRVPPVGAESCANWASAEHRLEHPNHTRQVGISRHPHALEKGGPRLPYDPDVIDYFFVVDSDMTMHLIPSRVVAGRVAVGLQTYKTYIVGNRMRRGGRRSCRSRRERITLAAFG
jgi:hypothetical protein